MDPDTERKSDISSISMPTEEDHHQRALCIVHEKAAALEYLEKTLNEALLESLRTQLELLTKSYFSVIIIPKQIELRERNNQVMSMNMYDLIDGQRFIRMKKIAISQTKIQLFLSQEYFHQLIKGRAELMKMVQSYDDSSPTKGGVISQRMAELTTLLQKFKDMLLPRQLRIKHRFIPCAVAIQIPTLQLFLNTKPPVMFDREESIAFADGAFLCWCVPGQANLTEKYELQVQQLKSQGNQDVAYRRLYFVSASLFKIDHLLPEQTYKFSIKRVNRFNTICNEWSDVITLKTRQAGSPSVENSHPFGDYLMSLSRSHFIHPRTSQ